MPWEEKNYHAYQTTVNENKITIAILPSGVNVIKPASNKKLAKDIIESGGCLVSEYEPDTNVFKGTYVERDHVVAAFSDETFVIQSGIKSGNLLYAVSLERGVVVTQLQAVHVGRVVAAC